TEVAAGEAGMETLAGCLAMAAFFSGGNVSQPPLPPLPPPPFVTGRFVSAAGFPASGAREPAPYQGYLRPHPSGGLAIARGKYLWSDHQLAAEIDEFLELEEMSIGAAPVPPGEQSLLGVS